MKFDKPTKFEVGVIPTRIGEFGCEFIPYVKGYAIARILDEAVGPLGWQKQTRAIPRPGESPVMVTSIAIYDKDSGNWISKDGLGEPVNNQGDKAQETDSLKRAALSWGIGRELRVMADKERLFIDASLLDMECLEGFDSVPIWRLRSKLNVTDLEYSGDGNVKYLVVSDGKGKMLFTYGAGTNTPLETETVKPAKAAKEKAVKASLKKPKEDKAVTEAKKIIIDCGGKELAGQKLADASAQQMLWIFRHTQSPSVKNALLTIAKGDSEVRDIFVADGVKV